MESKFEKVNLKVKIQLVYGEPFEQRIPGKFREFCWTFAVNGFPYRYSDEEIENNLHRFEVVLKRRKIKSVVMKSKMEWIEGLKSYYNSVSNEYCSEDFMLNHPDKFIIEYED